VFSNGSIVVETTLDEATRLIENIPTANDVRTALNHVASLEAAQRRLRSIAPEVVALARVHGTLVIAEIPKDEITAVTGVVEVRLGARVEWCIV